MEEKYDKLDPAGERKEDRPAGKVGGWLQGILERSVSPGKESKVSWGLVVLLLAALYAIYNIVRVVWKLYS